MPKLRKSAQPDKLSNFTKNVISAVKMVPRGRVATYGQIAALAGNPNGSRQVSWVLNACSTKYRLPWHRIINAKGRISLPLGGGYELQRALLQEEKVKFDESDAIDLKKYGWVRPFP
jgi:methylated-DNA-protein-cysteine methyltransferase-like protein